MHWPVNAVCACGHGKGHHWFSKGTPKGPCRECGCTAFTPEPICVCGHGKKAHDRPSGYCNQKYLDGCTGFRDRAVAHA